MDKTTTRLIDCCDVQLHGWDAAAGFWHGPTPLTRAVRGAHTTARKIANACGAFHGKLRCSVPGLPCMEFQTEVYDLMDIGLAIVHLDGALGPVGFVALIPAARRKRLRPEFAFEFVSFLSFLGGTTKAGSELTVHDYIESAVRTETSSAQIFTLETAELSPDVSIVLSAHFEHLSIAMLDWLAMKDEGEAETFESGATAACAIGAAAAAA